MTALPPFKVEIDADPDLSGLVIVDDSTLDGGDVLAEDVRYVSVTADDVTEISIRRGRSRDDQANDAGTATLVFDAWSGDYDPDNEGGAYTYNGQRLLRQGMQVRVSVTISSVDYVLFTGALESTAAGFGWQPTMTWTCVDMLSRLGHASFPPSAAVEREGDTSEERIDWLLQYDPAYEDRRVTSGGRTLVGTQGGGTVLSNLEDVARSEWGRVYADRDNTLVVTHHADEYSRTTDLVISDSGADTGNDVFLETFADLFPGLAVLSPVDLNVEPGLSLVVNYVNATRNDVANVVDTDGNTTVTTTPVVFTSTDGLSMDKFGQRSQDVDILLSDDSDAQALADYLAVRRSVPSPWLSAVSTSLSGASTTAMTSAAQVDLGAWVRVERTTPDGRMLVWRVTAEGIAHTISTTGWDLSLSTSPADLSSLFGSGDWMTLDASVLDGADVLAAY